MANTTMDICIKYSIRLLLLSTWMSLTVCHRKEFVVEESNIGFTVTLVRDDQSVKIIEHSTENPFLFVGNGETEFKVTEGNVHISDYVHYKIPLVYYIIEEVGDVVQITLHDGVQDSSKVGLQLSTSNNHQLELHFVDFPEAFDRLWIRLVETEKEHLYGGGEQFTHFDMNGHKFQIWTREQGIGRNISSPITYVTEHMGGGYGGDYHYTYFPQPTYTSSRKYYCHIASTTFTELDFTQQNFHEIMMFAKPTAIFFNSASSMTGVLKKLTSFLKRQPILPDWVRNGVILGIQGGTKQMLDHLDTAEKHGLSVSGLWIQDWAGKIVTSFGKRVFWNWEWNERQYPGLDKEIKRLSDRGVKLLAYITPHMNVNGNLYQSNKYQDYFMKNMVGEQYLVNFGEFLCATVDLTNEQARTWYKGVIKKNLIEFGFGGWMADFSEYIPVDAVFSNGETGRTMHNKMPMLWARTNREAVEEAGKLGEVMFYMRAGGTGSQAYSTMFWAGDQSVDFSYSDGLPSTIPAALSLGMSGFGMTHFDIGGYTTVLRQGQTREVSIQLNLTRTEELFMRGAEMAVFTPIMRTHEGNVPMMNFQIYQHPDAMRKFAVLVNMFKALSDYTKSLMQENRDYGIPLQRPLFLQYEEDCKSYSISYQYMYGSDLLVAPVVEQGKDTWEVYLPPDTWVHLFNGHVYSGGQVIQVAAPIGKPPVFYRDGTKWRDTFENVAEIAKQYNNNNVKSEL